MLETVPDVLLRSEAEERRIMAEENKEAIKLKRAEHKSELDFKKIQVLAEPEFYHVGRHINGLRRQGVLPNGLV